MKLQLCVYRDNDILKVAVSWYSLCTSSRSVPFEVLLQFAVVVGTVTFNCGSEVVLRSRLLVLGQ